MARVWPNRVPPVVDEKADSVAIDITGKRDVTYSVVADVLVGAGGALDGMAVQGSNYITRVQEYAAGRFEIDFDYTGEPQMRWQTDVDCADDAPGLILAPEVVGDVDLAMEWDLTTLASDSNQMMGVALWDPTGAGSDNKAVGAFFGNSSTTNGYTYLLRHVRGALNLNTPLVGRAWTLRQFLRVERDGQDVTAYRKTLVGDAWTTAASEKWDTVGGNARAGVVLGSDAGAGPVTLRIYNIAGYYTPRSELR